MAALCKCFCSDLHSEVTDSKERKAIGFNEELSTVSNFSPRRVIDVADVVPFPDTATKRSCCEGIVSAVVVGQGERTEEKVSPVLFT